MEFGGRGEMLGTKHQKCLKIGVAKAFTTHINVRQKQTELQHGILTGNSAYKVYKLNLIYTDLHRRVT